MGEDAREREREIDKCEIYLKIRVEIGLEVFSWIKIRRVEQSMSRAKCNRWPRYGITVELWSSKSLRNRLT